MRFRTRFYDHHLFVLFDKALSYSGSTTAFGAVGIGSIPFRAVRDLTPIGVRLAIMLYQGGLGSRGMQKCANTIF